ncbi:MAG: hypothetical protein HZB10_00095 [Candidatus Yonathbacteria bacterium]|nr:hypothetical protein [Candidatus Yonathbacteria bacterium]
MKKIHHIIDQFMKDFLRIHVVLVHSPDDNSGISIEGVLSVHIGELAAKRMVQKLRARRPQGVRFQFIALELGRVKTSYCFDEWLPEYVSPLWKRRLKRAGSM